MSATCPRTRPLIHTVAVTYFGIGKRALDVAPEMLRTALEIKGYSVDVDTGMAVRSADVTTPLGRVTNSFIATVTAEGQLLVECFRHLDIEAGPYRPTGRTGRTISRLGVSRSACAEAESILQTAARYAVMQAELDAIVGG